MLSPFDTGKKAFFLTSNVVISQTVRNECVSFGRYLYVSYKILRLEILNEAPNFLNSPYFQ
jgi:hypothetical protein